MATTALELLAATTGDTSAPLLRRDRWLQDDQAGGVKWMFDASADCCFPGGLVNGATALNLCRKPLPQFTEVLAAPADGSIVIPTGQAPTRHDGQVDFAPLTDRGAYVAVPASVMAAYAASTAKQISIGVLMKLPAEADFTTAATALAFLSFGATATGYVSGINPFEFTMQTVAGAKVIRAYRQKGAANGSADIFTATLPNGWAGFGKWALVHFSRVAAGQQLTIYSSAGTIAGTGAGPNDNAENTQNFSASAGYLGVGLTGWAAGLTGQLAASNFSIGAAWFDLPDVSGWDAQAKAAEYWTRAVQRGVFL